MMFTDVNGLVVWSEREIDRRDYFIKYITNRLCEQMCFVNNAWTFHRIEYPVIIPTRNISKNYEKDDFFSVGDRLSLRPETTWGSYEFLKSILPKGGEKNLKSSYFKPPVCVYQSGLSFRNEQDKTLRHMRLKQFYQLEYQFIYSKGTKQDYPSILKYVVHDCIRTILCRFDPEEIIQTPSDRLPSYSKETTDIIADGDLDPMEVCSMSERTDAPYDLCNFEVSIGLDRLLHLYAWNENA